MAKRKTNGMVTEQWPLSIVLQLTTYFEKNDKIEISVRFFIVPFSII